MDQSREGKKRFGQMVKEASPNSHIVTNCIKAFVTGGGICVIGQAFTDLFLAMGAAKDDASMYTSITLIFLGVLLTGLGLYDKLGSFAGAGSIVPITGFANAVAAPAIEFKKEGFLLGVGSKLFVVAGPVIVYGVLTSVVVGVVYYFVK